MMMQYMHRLSLECCPRNWSPWLPPGRRAGGWVWEGDTFYYQSSLGIYYFEEKKKKRKKGRDKR